MTFYDDIIAEVHAGNWVKAADMKADDIWGEKRCLGMMIHAMGGRLEVWDSVYQALIEWEADHSLVLPRLGGGCVCIIAFNDDPQTTADDVIHVVKRAREIAEAAAH